MHHGSHGSARRLVPVLLALAMVAAACGSGDEQDATGTTSPAPSSSTATPTGSGTSTPPVTPTKPKKRNLIAWVLGLGPGAPEGPPEFTAYRELQQRRCEVVFDRVNELREPARTLYTGAAQACLAAFSGRDELWDDAAAARDEVSGRKGELTCMDRAAFALLERLVSLHAAHPDRSFAAAAERRAKPPPCPRIERTEPQRGPQGTAVRMTGRNLPGNVVGVSVVDSLGGSLPVEDLAVGSGVLTFTMPEAPPPEASATVCLVVRADPDWSADGALFTYESDLAGAATPLDCPPAEAG